MKVEYKMFHLSATEFPELIESIVYKTTLNALKKGRDSTFTYEEDHVYSEIVNGEYIMNSFDDKQIESWLVELRVISSQDDEKEIQCNYKDKVTSVLYELGYDSEGLIKNVMYYVRKNILKKL